MAKGGRYNILVLIVYLLLGLLPGILYLIFQKGSFNLFLCIIGFIFGLIPGILYLIFER